MSYCKYDVGKCKLLFGSENTEPRKAIQQRMLSVLVARSAPDLEEVRPDKCGRGRRVDGALDGHELAARQGGQHQALPGALALLAGHTATRALFIS